MIVLSDVSDHNRKVPKNEANQPVLCFSISFHVCFHKVLLVLYLVDHVMAYERSRMPYPEPRSLKFRECPYHIDTVCQSPQSIDQLGSTQLFQISSQCKRVTFEMIFSHKFICHLQCNLQFFTKNYFTWVGTSFEN